MAAVRAHANRLGRRLRKPYSAGENSRGGCRGGREDFGAQSRGSVFALGGEAEVKFLDGDFRIVRAGAYVRCAVTGTPIPLEELKYWSVERQEAYIGPAAVLERLFPSRVP